MSDVAKKARAAMKSKAQRLGSSRPLEKVDSSTWTPPELLNADVKTGMRPISRRAFKKGGKVMGDCGPTRADRAPRKSGGKAITADSLINRNQKEANEERAGIKHIGGMKKGGRAKKMDGGVMSPAMAGAARAMARGQAVGNVPGGVLASQPTSSRLSRSAGLKKGGKAEGHEDIAADKALIKKMVKPSARTGKKEGGFLRTLGDRVAGDLASDEAMKLKDKVLGGLSGDNYKKGGRTGKAKGGGMPLKGHGYHAKTDAELRYILKDASEAARNMKGMDSRAEGKYLDQANDASTVLGYRKRGGQQIPVLTKGDDSFMNKGGRTGRATGGQVFSGPGYPGKVPGVVSGGRTARATGGSAKRKGKTAINIVINAGKADDGSLMPPPGPMGGPKGMPIPLPPAGAGMPPGAAPPMPMPPPGLAGAGAPAGGPPMPPGGMPPMPRKRGGRTYQSYKDMDAGAGSGKGRLEKTEIAEHKRGERKAGGRTYRSYKDMDAGAGSGLGRLEKTEIAAHKSGIQKA
jgi:hypothetical protein